MSEATEEGTEVVKGLNQQHTVAVALSARVRADEKVGQMACSHHSSAQAFFQIGFGPQLFLETHGNIFISTTHK